MTPEQEEILGWGLPAGLYRHYRGDYYWVEGWRSDSTNGRDDAPMVAYSSCDPQPGIPDKVRDAEEFFETVHIDTGEVCPQQAMDEVVCPIIQDNLDRNQGRIHLNEHEQTHQQRFKYVGGSYPGRGRDE